MYIIVLYKNLYTSLSHCKMQILETPRVFELHTFVWKVKNDLYSVAGLLDC